MVTILQARSFIKHKATTRLTFFLQRSSFHHPLSTSAMDPQAIYKNPDVAGMAYANCNTRIISLEDIDISSCTTERHFKDIYSRLSKSSSSDLLITAVNSIRLGIAPPVAFPTETVYGLGADATNRASIAGIFAAKGRPSDNPLIVHVASKEHLERLTGEPIPAVYESLVKERWPGPLTILVPVPKKSVFAENVHPGQNTIGFRVPESKFARFFIAATDRPIAAPSANSSGKPSPTTAQHVMDDLNGKINFILDGGDCDVGVESTVVDGLHDPPLILRPGGVSQADLIEHGKRYDNAWINTGIGYKQAQDSINHDNESSAEEAPRAPGMKYKHYAPRGKLLLFDNSSSTGAVRSRIDVLVGQTSSTQILQPHREHAVAPLELRFAILTTTKWSSFASLSLDNADLNGHVPNGSLRSSSPQGSHYRGHQIYNINLGTKPKDVARSLFAALRTCDDLGCHYIFAEAPTQPLPEEGMDHHYDAVLERMRKAASELVNP